MFTLFALHFLLHIRAIQHGIKIFSCSKFLLELFVVPKVKISPGHRVICFWSLSKSFHILKIAWTVTYFCFSLFLVSDTHYSMRESYRFTQSSARMPVTTSVSPVTKHSLRHGVTHLRWLSLSTVWIHQLDVERIWL